jgi:hypothetical protein
VLCIFLHFANRLRFLGLSERLRPAQRYAQARSACRLPKLYLIPRAFADRCKLQTSARLYESSLSSFVGVMMKQKGRRHALGH